MYFFRAMLHLLNTCSICTTLATFTKRPSECCGIHMEIHLETWWWVYIYIYIYIYGRKKKQIWRVYCDGKATGNVSVFITFFRIFFYIATDVCWNSRTKESIYLSDENIEINWMLCSYNKNEKLLKECIYIHDNMSLLMFYFNPYWSICQYAMS